MRIPRPIPALFAAFLFAAPFLHAQDPEIPADKDPVTTESGLQYSILTAGRPGPSPKFGDTVRVEYTGWLTDGKMFDSSRKRGEPVEFKLGAVVEGWNEALQLMTPGARWKLTVPAALAYGERGAGGVIPPNSTLIFDVELLDFTAGPALPEVAEVGEELQTTESGLKYCELEEGEGVPPTGDELLELRYAIWLPDGKMLDCSELSTSTITGSLEELRLPFLKEAAAMMKPGDRYQFVVPPALAFGEEAQPKIPANSTLTWQLELVQVVRFVAPDPAAQVTTESGLKYEVLKEGEGEKPTADNAVSVHYAGWLTDGTLFDSSYSRGRPATFPLGGVIKGWTEGLQLMSPGAVYRFTIPGDLAYGESGSPPKIGPNATLVFLVELVQVH